MVNFVRNIYNKIIDKSIYAYSNLISMQKLSLVVGGRCLDGLLGLI